MNKVSTISGLQQLIQDTDIRLKKKWGQNFLVDGNILKKIAAYSGASQNDYVVEIGAGAGALTQELALAHKGVLAIDIDTSLQPVLSRVLAAHDNVRVIFQDVLKTDIEAELMRAFGLAEVPPYTVCANIPYNITTPIIFKLLEQNTNLQMAILMMQKEVAGRILAKPGNKDFGLLTLTVAYHAEVQFLMNVSAHCFYPRPQVDSAVIKFSPLKEKKVKIKAEKQFHDFLKFAFQKRRKTMLNITAAFFTYDKDKAEHIFKRLKIASQRRPETLTLQEFACIVETFRSEKPI